MAQFLRIHGEGVVRPGSVLMGKWRIVRELAHGGTSTVYEAAHRNGRHVAVKVLRPALAADQRGRTRFLRESALANRVNHPGVISIIDEEVTSDGLVFLVMELLAGETLEQRWVRHDKRLPLADAMSITADILEPLAAVHRVGIVHRDLKPSNVFLSTHGVKLLDFGVARLREINPDEGTITRSGAMLGTPAFMAPEQARGHWHDVDARTDIWAVGAILFALVSGRYVHEGQTPNELLIASATQSPVSLGRYAPDVPAQLVALVDRALLRDKELRWPDAATMLGELRVIQEIVPGSTQPVIAAAPSEETTAAAATTLPEESIAQLSTRGARRSGPGTARAFLLASVGIAVVVIATVVKTRSGATSPAVASSHATDVRSVEARTLPTNALVSPAAAPPVADAPRARRVRHARSENARRPTHLIAETGPASSAAPNEILERPRAAQARQTFSGIAVEDDALDQRR